MNKNFCECCSSELIIAGGNYDHFSHFTCNDCRYEFFVHEGPEAVNLLYENDSDYTDDLSVSGNYQDLLQWQHLIALKYIHAFNKENLSILDVGCFNGFFVKKLGDMGYDACGIDFNNKAIEYGAVRYGLGKVIAVKDINELAQENKTYDIITLFDVIEHVEHPQALLLSLKGLLRKGGMLILSAPNNRMFWRPALDYPPHHLSRFYPATIRTFLSRSGFKTVQQFEQMSVYNLVRHFIGSHFRNKGDKSLRGGRLRKGHVVDIIRMALNRLMKAGNFIFYPLDRLLYACGVRYISQIVVCEKIE